MIEATSAGAILFRDTRDEREYLLLKSRPGDWEFPKGGVEGDEELRVPLHETAAGEAAFEEWSYTVYRRRVDVVGHQEFAGSLATRSYPDGVHVAVEVEQQSSMG